MAYQDNNPGYGRQSSSLAVISLIAGIASYFIVPVLGALVAVITGGMAKKEILQSGGRISGFGMANWGIILGWINIAIGLIGICVFLLTILGVISLSSFAVCLPFANMDF